MDYDLNMEGLEGLFVTGSKRYNRLPTKEWFREGLIKAMVHIQGLQPQQISDIMDYIAPAVITRPTRIMIPLLYKLPRFTRTPPMASYANHIDHTPTMLWQANGIRIIIRTRGLNILQIRRLLNCYALLGPPRRQDDMLIVHIQI